MAHHLPGLINNLLSVSVLVDTGCEVFFFATGCKVTFNGKIILRGWCDPKNQLWWVRIMDDGWTMNLTITNNIDNYQQELPHTAQANSLYDCENTSQLTQFYHACLFLPVKSMLVAAINNGYLKGFSGLTVQRVNHHIPINNATKKGHMDQVQQGLWSKQ
jgi:hypothetical protein